MTFVYDFQGQVPDRIIPSHAVEPTQEKTLSLSLKKSGKPVSKTCLISKSIGEVVSLPSSRRSMSSSICSTSSMASDCSTSSLRSTVEGRQKLTVKGSKHGSENVFVGGLPESCSTEAIKAAFGAYGRVSHVVLKSGGGKPNRPFAFVWYLSVSDAENALKECDRPRVRADLFRAVQGDSTMHAAKPAPAFSRASAPSPPGNRTRDTLLPALEKVSSWLLSEAAAALQRWDSGSSWGTMCPHEEVPLDELELERDDSWGHEPAVPVPHWAVWPLAGSVPAVPGLGLGVGVGAEVEIGAL